MASFSSVLLLLCLLLVSGVNGKNLRLAKDDCAVDGCQDGFHCHSSDGQCHESDICEDNEDCLEDDHHCHFESHSHLTGLCEENDCTVQTEADDCDADEHCDDYHCHGDVEYATVVEATECIIDFVTKLAPAVLCPDVNGEVSDEGLEVQTLLVENNLDGVYDKLCQNYAAVLAGGLTMSHIDFLEYINTFDICDTDLYPHEQAEAIVTAMFGKAADYGICSGHNDDGDLSHHILDDVVCNLSRYVAYDYGVGTRDAIDDAYNFNEVSYETLQGKESNFFEGLQTLHDDANEENHMFFEEHSTIDALIALHDRDTTLFDTFATKIHELEDDGIHELFDHVHDLHDNEANFDLIVDYIHAVEEVQNFQTLVDEVQILHDDNDLQFDNIVQYIHELDNADATGYTHNFFDEVHDFHDAEEEVFDYFVDKHDYVLELEEKFEALDGIVVDATLNAHSLLEQYELAETVDEARHEALDAFNAGVDPGHADE